MEQSLNQPQRLMTIPQVAVYLQVSRPTVYALIYNNGLPFIKMGKSIRISLISLERWLVDREQQIA
jgi:excisionase family DNA binding protein